VWTHLYRPHSRRWRYKCGCQFILAINCGCWDCKLRYKDEVTKSNLSKRWLGPNAVDYIFFLNISLFSPFFHFFSLNFQKTNFAFLFPLFLIFNFFFQFKKNKNPIDYIFSYPCNFLGVWFTFFKLEY
jgi:hypothetical protein